MAASAVKPGILGKVYRNTGTYGEPTWTEITLIRDVNTPRPWDLASADVRATRVKLYYPTQMDITPSITVRADDLDTGYKALSAASNNATMLDLLILNGPLTQQGSEGVRAHFYVSRTGEDQSIGAIIYPTFDLRPGFSADGVPKYISMGATSTLVATDPGTTAA